MHEGAFRAPCNLSASGQPGRNDGVVQSAVDRRRGHRDDDGRQCPRTHPRAPSQLAVTGTSGRACDPRVPALVSVSTASSAAPARSASTSSAAAPIAMGAPESAGVMPRSALEQRVRARRAARRCRSWTKHGAATAAPVTWTANSTWAIADHRSGRQRAHDEGLSGHDQHVDHDGDGRRACRRAPTTSTCMRTVTTGLRPDRRLHHQRAGNQRQRRSGSRMPPTRISRRPSRAPATHGNYVKFSITAAGFTLRRRRPHPRPAPVALR